MITSHKTQDRNAATNTVPRSTRGALMWFLILRGVALWAGSCRGGRTRAQGAGRMISRHMAIKTMSCGFQYYVSRFHRHTTRYCIRYAPRQPDRASRSFQYYVTRYTIPRGGVWKTTSAAGLPPQPHFSQKGAFSPCSPDHFQKIPYRSTVVELSRIRLCPKNVPARKCMVL